MKAIRLHAFGGPANLCLEEVAQPQPGPGEVLLRNRAAGVNPIDWKTCSGGGASAAIGELPFIPGWECAGTVVATGSAVSGFAAGDEVLGFLRFPQPAGCFAEYVLAPAEQLALRPAALDLYAAGGLGLAGLTAYQALHDKGGLRAGQRVLVLAAAGGVGHLAVQLAKAAGAEVIGTASAGNQTFLQTLGCDRTLDYRQGALSAQIQDVDLIIDGVGGQTAIDALSCLKPGGLMVTLPSVTAAEVSAAAEGLGCHVEGIRAEPNGAQLSELAALAAAGQLTLTLGQVLPLAEAGEAFRLSASGHQRGKLVLAID